MQVGIFAKTFPELGARPVLTAARNAGYAAVQFNMACMGLPAMPDEIAAEMARDVATASHETGVAIAALSGTYNMIHPDRSVRADGLRRLAVIIAAAQKMGVPMVTLCTGTRDAQDQWKHHPDNDTPEAWADLRTEMQKAVQLAEAHGVVLGIEPELANVICSATHARKLIDEMKSSALRIVLDPANLFEVETDARRRDIIAQAVDLLADRIAMAHAKDRDARGDFVAAGTGVIDFSDFITRLKASGFNGPLITHGLTASEAPDVAQFLNRIVAA